MIENQSCPLCSSNAQKDFENHGREFYTCATCDLTFVNRDQILERDEEQVRYELHDNSIRSEGYLNFLYRLINIVKREIQNTNENGLDFGSGPYPMMLELLVEEGFKNSVGYDPFFNKNEKVWDQKFKFITVCEVIEHVVSLHPTIEKLLSVLEDDGVMIFSTGIKPSDVKSWHYIVDPTHISLFGEKTFDWMSENFGLNYKIEGKDLITFWKK